MKMSQNWVRSFQNKEIMSILHSTIRVERTAWCLIIIVECHIREIQQHWEYAHNYVIIHFNRMTVYIGFSQRRIDSVTRRIHGLLGRDKPATEEDVFPNYDPVLN